MLSLIFAAAAAAAQPTAPMNMQGQMPMQMGQMQGTNMNQMDHSKMGQIVSMKECCCKDMMSKMQSGETTHAEHKDR